MYFLIVIVTVLFFTIEVDGESMRNRIVGGQPADITSFPYQLSLSRNGRFTCGASILSKDTAVTAAHCVFDEYTNAAIPETELSITAGNSDYRYGIRVNISKVKIHPNFNYRTLDNDIALLNLQVELIFSSSISPVKLPSTNNINVGSKVNVSGWGLTAESGSLSDILMYVEVEIISQIVCQTQYAFYDKVTSNMICAGIRSGGKDSCNGDSGGPLTQGDVLIGIVSWGRGCARRRFPGVYTRVANYLNFLH